MISRTYTGLYSLLQPVLYVFFPLLLIHKLGDPKCMVSGISGCSDMFVIIRHFRVSVRRTGTFLVYYKRGGPILCNA